ncbi:MAG: PASTA domain-containing protein [Flavobacteriales bacterium]|nr:PASTA domain-containing protein [Flavobacteriales bacterium]
MPFLQFAKTKDFRKHLLRIVLVNLVIVLLIWLYLRWYTDHGEFVSVPDLKTMSLEEAAKSLEERDLNYMIVDSLYNEGEKGGTVFSQSPEPESKVKEGRKIFLKVYSMLPPMEKINIEEGEYGAVALIKLRNKGMKVTAKEEDNNTFVASVIRVMHQGRRIKAGEELPRGSDVTVFIGRATHSKVVVPNLVGLGLDSLQLQLESAHLLLGNIIFDFPESPSVSDSSLARTCRQDPAHDPELPVAPGTFVDVYLSTQPCVADTTTVNSIADPQ